MSDPRPGETLDRPDDVVMTYRDHRFRSDEYPKGVECLIHIPQSGIEAALKRGLELPAGVQHGAVVNMRSPREGA